MIGVILATDMGRHMADLNAMKMLLEVLPPIDSETIGLKALIDC